MTFILCCSILMNVVLFIIFLGAREVHRKWKSEAAAHRITKLEHESLRAQWNAMVIRINQLGGSYLLRTGKVLHGASVPVQDATPFTADELRKLVKVCHPDKHGGDATMESITKKLLAMRK